MGMVKEMKWVSQKRYTVSLIVIEMREKILVRGSCLFPYLSVTGPLKKDFLTAPTTDFLKSTSLT
jgi:hypothetical protein